MVVPLGVRLIGSEGAPGYLIPAKLIGTWTYRGKSYSRNYEIRPEGKQTTGIVLKVGDKNIVLTEPPPVKK